MFIGTCLFFGGLALGWLIAGLIYHARRLRGLARARQTAAELMRWERQQAERRSPERRTRG